MKCLNAQTAGIRARRLAGATHSINMDRSVVLSTNLIAALLRTPSASLSLSVRVKQRTPS